MIRRPNIQTRREPPEAAQQETTLWACDLRDGRGLAEGLYNDARNVRCPDGRPETRKGVVKPAWANRTTAGSDTVSPYGPGYGGGVFRDPDGEVDWQVIAADGYAWRTRPYNQSVQIPLPAGVRLLGPCTFVQAFNKLFCFRGRYLATLRLTNFTDGFEDLLDHWSSAVTHAKDLEVFYGPWQEVSTPVLLGAGELTSASTTATVTHTAHGFATGDLITILGATQTEYNGTYEITVTGTDTFTYTFAGSGTSPATGTIYMVKSGLTRTGNTVTIVTPQPHGYVTGADVVITGASDSAYNGRVNITVLDAYTFTYYVAGAPATPDTGTIQVSNMAHAYRALGTLLTVTSITRSSSTATVTKAGHGFSNGDTVTIAGAVETEYNGTYVITNVATDTFDYTVSGTPATPATGTITVRNHKVLAGESPTSHPANWQRIYDILPNAETGLFANNRLLVPTAYTPGTTGYNSSAVSYTKVDFIVATDIQDEIHIDFSDEFRINQGSADEIVDLAKWSEDVVVIWKGKSWGVLSNVAPDLTSVRWDTRSRSYGLSARGAWAEAGDNLVFVSDKRGFVNIRQSESGKLIGVDVPMSAPIQKLIDRIDWRYKDGIRLANWNSHLYAAVPLDGGSLTTTNAGQIHASGTITGLPGIPDQTFNLTAPRYYVAESNPLLLIYYDDDAGYWYVSNIGALRYRLSAVQPVGTWEPVGIGPHDSYAPTTELVETTLAGVNNALLVFSFVSAAMLQQEASSGQQGWLPLDTGSVFNVHEWFKAPLDGVERLFYLTTDGWVNLMEESDRGDQVAAAHAEGYTQGLLWEEIETRLRFRPQGAQLVRLQSPHGASLALETFNPQYSVTAHFEGVNKRTTLATDVTRSATRYFRPWNAPAYDPTNYNADHATPYREDYRVQFAGEIAAGGEMTSGYVNHTIEPGRRYYFTQGNATSLNYSYAGASIELTTSGWFVSSIPTVTIVGNPGDEWTGSLDPLFLNFTPGLRLLQFQEQLIHYRLAGRQGRSVAIELSNTQGRVRWQGILTRSLPGRQRKGVQV